MKIKDVKKSDYSVKQPGTVPDAEPDNWVHILAPAGIRPYLMLARLDRPAGIWLLLWPCLWSLALFTPKGSLPDVWMMICFSLGSVVMRGAGCTFNDIIDRDVDAKISRTAARPVASGEISRRKAGIFLIMQALIGLAILVQFNIFTILLGITSLGLVIIYPFMKRITWWPQAWLGLTFNWGALMGGAAITGGLSVEALLLYGGCVFWTIGYDTIYAHQDREDDALIGVKSSARRLGSHTRKALLLCYGLFVTGLGLAFLQMGFGWIFGTGLFVTVLQLLYQIKSLDINDSRKCLMLFKSNIGLGYIMFLAMAIDLVS